MNAALKFNLEAKLTINPFHPRQRGWAWMSLVMMSTAGAAPLAEGQASACQQLKNATDRLACYDAVFGAPSPDETPPDPAAATTPATAAQPQNGVAPAPPSLSLADALDAMWELTPETRRRKFVVRTYMPNYLLPIDYVSHVNRAPESPTRGPAPPSENYLNTQAKLQISLRAKVMSDTLAPNDSLWFAYTQLSSWQLWDHHDSAPFRDTDYQPEVIYVLPVPARLNPLPDGWRLRMGTLSFMHQSNGQSDPLSRSWNRLSAGLSIEKGVFALSAQAMYRIPESRSSDDNPGISDYVGSWVMRAVWLPGRLSATATFRISPQHMGRGSQQLDLSYPLSSDEMFGLRAYVQLFSGYGATLLDYNHRQTSLGLGVMLFQF
jgi:phospholipase A1